MAAPARSPGPADARLPCPLCGGLIHPIAGRCKHCKGDLSAIRGARPAAAAALPALASVKASASGPSEVPGAPVTTAPHDGLARHYAGPTVAASPRSRGASPVVAAPPVRLVGAGTASRADSAPILPPRPTGRMQAHGTRRALRSWPLIVIAIAALAIVAAVILMMWPPAKPGAAAATGAPGRNGGALEMPAPDRMPTDPGATTPQPRPTQPADPWKPADPLGAAPTAPTPSPANPFDPHAQIDPGQTGPKPPPGIDDPDFLGPNPPSPLDLSTTLGNLGGGQAIIASMISHACDRITRCPSVDTTVTLLCQSAGTFLSASGPAPTCAAAQRCLARVDAMDCSALSDGTTMSTTVFMSALTSVQDCMAAMQC